MEDREIVPSQYPRDSNRSCWVAVNSCYEELDYRKSVIWVQCNKAHCPSCSRTAEGMLYAAISSSGKRDAVSWEIRGSGEWVHPQWLGEHSHARREGGDWRETALQWHLLLLTLNEFHVLFTRNSDDVFCNPALLEQKVNSQICCCLIVSDSFLFSAWTR